MEDIEHSIIWNPWHGCVKYSEGCAHCYMYYLDKQRDANGSYIYQTKNKFRYPLSKDREGNFKIPSGSLVRVCMTSDFFLEEADEWRPAAWDIMRKRSDVHFWLLTKRAERIKDHLPLDWGEGWDHVSLNVTCENQKRVEERMPLLMEVPAKHKGVMVAPMLSHVDLSPYLKSGKIESVLADGENYDGMRPLHYEWVKDLHDQCAENKTPFIFVGTGNVFIKDGREYHIPKAYQRVQAKRAGLDYPVPSTDIRIQKKCAACHRRFHCNGCRWCGKCGSVSTR